MPSPLNLWRLKPVPNDKAIPAGTDDIILKLTSTVNT
jgi:hypothetical protein